MKYLNGANQQPQDAIGHWIQNEKPADVDHLRFKSGYFTLNGLSAFKSIIDYIAAKNRSITAVIGANGKETIQPDLDALLDLIQHPRPNTRLAITGFSNALFHPKVYHLSRTDGSQFAYVGSANLTPSGITGLNIETGILLDTRDGDNQAVLTEIANSIDNWFAAPLLNQTNLIGSKADIAQLVADGLVGVARPPRQNTNPPAGGKTKLPSLKPLISGAPIIPATAKTTATATTPPATVPVPATTANSGGVVASSNDMLVAEIGKGERWKQANFPKSVMQTYFGVDPLADEHIDLVAVDVIGAPSPPVDTQVVNVKSQNYRIELTAVNGVMYPATGRPIGVFRRTKAKEFRYHVYLPGDQAHASLDAFLNNQYAGPNRELRRVITQSSVISTIKPAIVV